MVLLPKPPLVPPTPPMGSQIPGMRPPGRAVVLTVVVFLFPPSLQGQHLAFPAVALWVTVGLAICVVGLLAVLAYVCQKKIRQSCEEEEENAGNMAGSPPQKRWGLQGEMDGG